MGAEHLILILFQTGFQRIWPLRPLAPGEAPLTAAERHSFGRWEAVVYGPVMFLVLPALWFAWAISLKSATEVCYQVPPGTFKILKISGIYWFVPAVPLAIFSAAAPTRWWAKCLLRERANRFHRACNEKSGIEWGQALRRLLGATLLGTVIYSGMIIHYCTRFESGGMRIGDPFHLRSRFVPYQAIHQIEHRLSLPGPSGKLMERPHFVFRFKDGSSWRLDLEHDISSDEKQLLVEWVAAQARLPIIQRP